MTRHARIGWRQACVGGYLNRCVAKPAIDPEPGNMVLVAERHGLLHRPPHMARVVRARKKNHQPTPITIAPPSAERASADHKFALGPKAAAIRRTPSRLLAPKFSTLKAKIWFPWSARKGESDSAAVAPGIANVDAIRI